MAVFGHRIIVRRSGMIGVHLIVVLLRHLIVVLVGVVLREQIR